MWMRVIVEFSPETSNVLVIIKEHKERLKIIHSENSILKKLCFFSGDIQSDASKKLHENKFRIECLETAIKTYQEIFVNLYEKDYKKSHTKTLKEQNSFNENNNSKQEQNKDINPIALALKNILKSAQSLNVFLDNSLNKKIQNRINKLS
jgi:hypothetical protein